MNAATGLASAIRSYLAEHPKTRLSVVAAAIGFSHARVGQEARRMAARGMLVREGRHSQYYSLGRAPITYDPDAVKENHRRSSREYKKRRRAKLAALRPPKPPKPIKEKPVKLAARKEHERIMTDPKKALRQAITDTVNAAKERPVSQMRAETVAEFEARGGRIEPVACTFRPPVAYGKFGGTMREVAGHTGSSM